MITITPKDPKYPNSADLRKGTYSVQVYDGEMGDLLRALRSATSALFGNYLSLDISGGEAKLKRITNRGDIFIDLPPDKLPELAFCISKALADRESCEFDPDTGACNCTTSATNDQAENTGKSTDDNQQTSETESEEKEAEALNNLKHIQKIIEKMHSTGNWSPLSPTIQVSSGNAFPLNFIFSGPPGTGKTHAAKTLLSKIKNAKQYAEVCFHPATAYEDFVRAMESDGRDGFKACNKTFGKICDDALQNPEKLFAILIEEINRANLPAVLGELMTALEYRGPESPVTLSHAVAPPSHKRKPNEIVVPNNLLVIGTMNTADRSTGLLDYALRRRFIFFRFKPTLSKAASDAQVKFKEALGLFYEDESKLTGRSDILAPESEPDDVAIGHSYFMGDDWKFKAKHQVAPLLKEYLRDGVLTNEDEIKKVISELENL